MSLLPSFALSYRLLNSELVKRFLSGQLLQGAEQRWVGLLQSYRARAQKFCPQLIGLIGMGFGLAPPKSEVGELVAWLTRLCGGLGSATEQLVNRLGLTLFGIYGCHQRTVDDGKSVRKKSGVSKPSFAPHNQKIVMASRGLPKSLP